MYVLDPPLIKIINNIEKNITMNLASNWYTDSISLLISCTKLIKPSKLICWLDIYFQLPGSTLTLVHHILTSYSPTRTKLSPATALIIAWFSAVPASQRESIIGRLSLIAMTTTQIQPSELPAMMSTNAACWVMTFDKFTLSYAPMVDIVMNTQNWIMTKALMQLRILKTLLHIKEYILWNTRF